MLNDPRTADRDAGSLNLVLDKYDPALAVQQGFRPIETVRTRSIFWCLVASVSVGVIMLIVDLA